jgi:hypothetical protein
MTSSPSVMGRGTVRRTVEGSSVPLGYPSTMLRMVPLPIEDGEDK